jgi:hypothetical protein
MRKPAVTGQISQNIAVLLTKHTPILKSTRFGKESQVMIVEFSTENYPSQSKDLQSKISLIQWQFKIAGFNLRQ